jgi:hypothetical protein
MIRALWGVGNNQSANWLISCYNSRKDAFSQREVKHRKQQGGPLKNQATDNMIKKQSMAPSDVTELQRNLHKLLRAALIIAAYLFAFIILDFIASI